MSCHDNEGCILVGQGFTTIRNTFLTFETEFVLFLAVLVNSVLPIG